ncbi:hypothetical protein [Fodinicola feengrottensis]|uniref:hypothetical protein n=1 Tax=Fodinicola feengrottensis TaxID=435914 RepID=UPI0013D625D0|nr:hypothetical protein [Fodinicola feengrottensis]
MTLLDPGDAKALVELRAMLRHAQQSARTTARVGQLTALILLDAVNERITHMAAQSLQGIEIKSKDGIETIYSRVKGKLATSMPANNGWAEVWKLHRARNIAQHEGIGPDPIRMSGWMIATERYVSSMVRVVFQVNIENVHLAEAVADPEMAAHLHAAEDFLEQGESGSAVEEVWRAFTPAYRKWINYFGDTHAKRPFRLQAAGQLELDEMIVAARNAAAAQAFAMEPAEYTWFAALQKTPSFMIGLDDARQALVFAFWWIVRWEAVAAMMVSPGLRRQRWMENEHSSRTREADGPAYLDEVEVRPISVGQGQTSFQVSFSLVNLPPLNLRFFQDWSLAVNDGLAALAIPGCTKWSAASWNINAEVTSGVDVEALVAAVEQVLIDADAVAARVATGRVRDEREHLRECDEFAQQIDSRRAELPSWVQDIYLARENEVVQGTRSSRLRVRVAEGARLDHQRMNSWLQAAPLVEKWGFPSDDVVALEPELNISQVLGLVSSLSRPSSWQQLSKPSMNSLKLS